MTAAPVDPASDRDRLAKPMVSVVIPTHQRPELMKQAVQSVLDQKVDTLGEVIVVFDACPVELPDVDVPSSWELHGRQNERSRGLAGARNTGILAARGELVASLDDDDEWLPGKLEAQLRLLEKHPAAVVVGCAMMVDDGSRQRARLAPSDRLVHEDFLASRVAAVHSSSLVFRRSELLGRLGLIDEDLPRSYGEDYDILLRASRLAPVEIVNEPLVRVLWSGQSYYFGRWAEYAEALQRLLAKHPEFATARGRGRLEAQIAFALAASGKSRDGRAWAWRALRSDFRQVKAYLAVLISIRVISASAIARFAKALGRGI